LAWSLDRLRYWRIYSRSVGSRLVFLFFRVAQRHRRVRWIVAGHKDELEAELQNRTLPAVVRTKPDGHTLLAYASPKAINPTPYNNLNFNFIPALAPVAGTARTWSGPFRPSLRNTPAEVIARLNKETNTAPADPAIKARIASLGSSALPETPPDFGKFVADETEKWGKGGPRSP
jgi:hypothetical protein